MALQYIYLLAVMSMNYYHPEDPGYINVYISGYRDTTVKYQLPWEQELRTIRLDQANDRTWRMSLRLTAEQADIGANRAIRVTSSDEVTIQVSRGKVDLTNAVAYTALPMTDDSNEFLVSSQPHSPIGLKDSQPLFIIGTAEHGAAVDVYNKFADGSPTLLFRRLLSPYRMLEIPSGELNITGIYVGSDRPIVVYSGHQCANVPVDVNHCEPLLQQVAPFSLVGSEYVLGPIRRRQSTGYTARIMTTGRGSDVILATRQARLRIEDANLRGCGLTDLGEVYNVQCRSPLGVGSYLDVHVTPADYPLVVKCSEPCYVYQMNRGGGEPAVDVRTDPFMALVPPLEQRSAVVRFSTVSSFVDGRRLVFTNFVSVVAPRNAVVLLDETVLPPGAGYTVGDYKVYAEEIEDGFHAVRTADGLDTNLVVQVYGHGPADLFTGKTAYGFPAAFFGLANSEKTTEPLPSTTTTSYPTLMFTTTTRRTTTADVHYQITDVISAKVPMASVSPAKAITTGILAAISVALIILVTCAIILAVIFIILRKRRNKCRSWSVDEVPPINATKTAVCVNEVGEVTALILRDGKFTDLVPSESQNAASRSITSKFNIVMGKSAKSQIV